MDSVGKKALKAGTWYTVCTFILKGLSFITMPLFTRLMSVAEIGSFSNMTSWIAILSGVLTLDLYTSINLAHYEYPDDIYGYMSTMVLTGTSVTALFFFGSLLLRDKVCSILGIQPYMLYVMFVYLMFYPAVSILHAKFRIYLQYRQTIITSLFPAILSVLTALLFVFLSADRLKGRIFGYFGVWITLAVFLYIFILSRGKSFRMEYVRFALPISVPLIVHTLANTLLSTSDRVMIHRICGPEGTAFYSIAYTCALVVSILWTSINQAWAPWCFEMMHQKKEREIGRVARPILILFSIGVAYIILIAPELLRIMGGEAYMQAVYVIPPVMLGYIAQMLYTLYVNIESYHKKQKQIMIGTMAAALLNIILNLIFIPLFGYVAAAYTTLAGYIALLFIHYYFVRRIGFDYIYDMRFNVTLLGGMLIGGCLISLLYRFNYVRWGIILLCTGILCMKLIRKKEDVISALREKNIIRLLSVMGLLKTE